MMTNLEALSALAECGTMTRAATRLRITQSAVSKRIAALENDLGRKCIEPAGRRVRLTPFGLRLLEKTNPFMATIREALSDETPLRGSRLVIGVSESILSSWGPPILSRVQRAVPQLELIVNAHRSPVAVDHVRSGEYTLALCAGVAENTPDLKSEILFEEPIIVVPSGLVLLDLARTARLPVLTIEPHAATWRCLEKRIKACAGIWPFTLEITQTLQSFAGIVQMARCGFGHGLVPEGIARALGLAPRHLVRLPAPGLSRPISLVGRRTVFARPLVKSFHRALSEAIDQPQPHLAA